MSVHEFSEKRRTPRRLLGRLVKIQIENGKSRLCLVTDISDGGVRIHVNGFEVPENFVLLFPEDGPTLKRQLPGCLAAGTKRWRRVYWCRAVDLLHKKKSRPAAASPVHLRN